MRWLIAGVALAAAFGAHAQDGWGSAGQDGPARVFYRAAATGTQKQVWIRSDEGPTSSYVALFDVVCSPRQMRTVQKQSFLRSQATGNPSFTAGAETRWTYVIPGTAIDRAVEAVCGTSPPAPTKVQPLSSQTAPTSRPSPAAVVVAEEIERSVPSPPAANNQPAALSFAPSVVVPRTSVPANNCYGCVSETTGRAKTTAVSGYYRKDGTYVRPYYRSKR